MSTTSLHEHDLSASPLRASAGHWRRLLATGSDWGTAARLALGTCALVAAAVLAVLT
ncbi:hypothetical protein [Nocardioides ferulae]|uniref:hypothetical protein n=1 Tax=Nocardioides ferulae TaxID=2340821 RepID=UPI0013DDD7E5|nr:hypothetical protein [Nocardioides ferulae]